MPSVWRELSTWTLGWASPVQRGASVQEREDATNALVGSDSLSIEIIRSHMMAVRGALTRIQQSLGEGRWGQQLEYELSLLDRELAPHTVVDPRSPDASLRQWFQPDQGRPAMDVLRAVPVWIFDRDGLQAFLAERVRTSVFPESDVDYSVRSCGVADGEAALALLGLQSWSFLLEQSVRWKTGTLKVRGIDLVESVRSMLESRGGFIDPQYHDRTLDRVPLTGKPEIVISAEGALVQWSEETSLPLPIVMDPELWRAALWELLALPGRHSRSGITTTLRIDPVVSAEGVSQADLQIRFRQHLLADHAPSIERDLAYARQIVDQAGGELYLQHLPRGSWVIHVRLPLRPFTSRYLKIYLLFDRWHSWFKELRRAMDSHNAEQVRTLFRKAA